MSDLSPVAGLRRDIRVWIRPGGSVDTNWCLHGPAATIVFRVRTGGGREDLPWGIDVHHRAEPEDVYASENPSCEFLSGEPCWCEGSSLQADHLWREVVKAAEDKDDPEDVIWRTLADRYARWVEGQDEPAESRTQEPQ